MTDDQLILAAPDLPPTFIDLRGRKAHGIGAWIDAWRQVGGGWRLLIALDETHAIAVPRGPSDSP